MAAYAHLRRGLLVVLACTAISVSAVDLKPATGMVVKSTPLLVAAPNARYLGSLNSDPANRTQVQGLYEVLAQESFVVAVHLVHVPTTDTYLYLERPSIKRNLNNSFQVLGGTFDLVTRVWTRVQTADPPFCAGHTVTSEGEIVVVGGMSTQAQLGDGMRSVRIYNKDKNPGQCINATRLSYNRWYPTATLLPDNQIMIMGGTMKAGGSAGGAPTYELYSPNTNPYQYPLPQWKVEAGFLKHMKRMYYPYNYVLPTGDVFSFGERRGRVLVAQTGVYRMNANGSYHMPLAALPGEDFTQYPTTASAVYGPLTYENNYSSVELMIFGGAKQSSLNDKTILTGRTVRRIKISWTKSAASSGYTYSFSDWVMEDMGISRVMGDATLLPNGDVILLNGAQVGVAGDGGGASYPAFWAQLYQPNLPLNGRVSTLAGSTVARMYHSTAALTTNATILVSGCDICGGLKSDVPGWKSNGQKWEYRNEIFYPPYFFDTANKPKIVSVNNGGKVLNYDQDFTITWTSVTGAASVPVTSVSLVAPSATTHSWNSNQRVVVLRVMAVDYNTNTITVRSPPHPYIAPPQNYMVFLMNGKTMSTAKWIKLEDATGAGKVVPK